MKKPKVVGKLCSNLKRTKPHLIRYIVAFPRCCLLGLRYLWLHLLRKEEKETQYKHKKEVDYVLNPFLPVGPLVISQPSHGLLGGKGLIFVIFLYTMLGFNVESSTRNHLMVYIITFPRCCVRRFCHIWLQHLRNKCKISKLKSQWFSNYSRLIKYTHLMVHIITFPRCCLRSFCHIWLHHLNNNKQTKESHKHHPQNIWKIPTIAS